MVCAAKITDSFDNFGIIPAAEMGPDAEEAAQGAFKTAPHHVATRWAAGASSPNSIVIKYSVSIYNSLVYS